MEGNSAEPRKAQLDKEEREHLEDVVTEMRDRVEANVRYQLEEYDLQDRPDVDGSLSDKEVDLVEAIELEAVDGNDWDDGYEQYITGVGYTIVNRLAALRCMEVRDFIDDEVTAFRDDGLTPAADRLVTEEFMLEEEAVLEAYRNACDDLAEEIDILFDRSSAYSLIDPDDDTYEDLCGCSTRYLTRSGKLTMCWVGCTSTTTSSYLTISAGRVTAKGWSPKTYRRRTNSTRRTGSCGCLPTTRWGSSISKTTERCRRLLIDRIH